MKIVVFVGILKKKKKKKIQICFKTNSFFFEKLYAMLKDRDFE